MAARSRKRALDRAVLQQDQVEEEANKLHRAIRERQEEERILQAEQRRKEEEERQLQQAIQDSLQPSASDDSAEQPVAGPSQPSASQGDEGDMQVDQPDVPTREERTPYANDGSTTTGRQYGSSVEDAQLYLGPTGDAKAVDWPYMVMMDNTIAGRGSVNGTAMSHDGTKIASASEDHFARIWDVKTGAMLHRFAGHTDVVWSVAFSPDDTQLVSGSADAKCIIWDIATGLESSRLGGHDGEVFLCDWQPSGALIATATANGSVKVWDAVTHELLNTFDRLPAGPLELKFTRDNKYLIVASGDATFIYNTNDYALHHKLGGRDGMVWGLGIDHEIIRIATCCENQVARVWSIETGEELVTLQDHSGPIWHAAFSPDGKRIVTGSFDKTMVHHDSYLGEASKVFNERGSGINTLVYSPDGELVAGACAEGGVKIWNVKTDQFVAEFLGHEEKVKSVYFTPDSEEVLSASDDGTIRKYNVADLLRL